jgi:BirA family biotin operon repressor/biotin-[acetyl-CoA-carboxylase] ligase
LPLAAQVSNLCSTMTLDARLLRELRANTVHLLPGDFANALDVPGEQIAEAFTRLRGAGFDIEERPGLGCRLLASPDRLVADDLHARLGDCPLAREILVFEETGSTNDVAMRLGREGHAAGLLVFAERQTAGRGRFGRRWDSAPHAGLWFSLLLRPEFPTRFWPRLTTWAGVCMAAAIEHATGLAAKLKWPNDVLIRGKKVAGILTECSSDAAGGMFAVVGIGLNVNHDAMPAEIADRAASLRQITGRKLDRSALATVIVAELAARLPGVDTTFDAILADAARRSSILGKWIRLDAAGTSFEGFAERLDVEGNLLLRLADGTVRTMTAGEVSSQFSSSVPAAK